MKPLSVHTAYLELVIPALVVFAVEIKFEEAPERVVKTGDTEATNRDPKSGSAKRETIREKTREKTVHFFGEKFYHFEIHCHL